MNAVRRGYCRFAKKIMNRSRQVVIAGCPFPQALFEAGKTEVAAGWIRADTAISAAAAAKAARNLP